MSLARHRTKDETVQQFYSLDPFVSCCAFSRMFGGEKSFPGDLPRFLWIDKNSLTVLYATVSLQSKLNRRRHRTNCLKDKVQSIKVDCEAKKEESE